MGRNKIEMPQWVSVEQGIAAEQSKLSLESSKKEPPQRGWVSDSESVTSQQSEVSKQSKPEQRPGWLLGDSVSTGKQSEVSKQSKPEQRPGWAASEGDMTSGQRSAAEKMSGDGKGRDDVRNNKIKFGFLNTAQDHVGIEGGGSTLLENVDLDKLKLGTIQVSEYGGVGNGLQDWKSTEIVNTKFVIADHDDNDAMLCVVADEEIEGYPSGGTIPYNIPIDDFLVRPAPPLVDMEVSKGGVSLVSPSAWVGFEGTDVTVRSLPGNVRPKLTDKVMIDPSEYGQTNVSKTVMIRMFPNPRNPPTVTDPITPDFDPTQFLASLDAGDTWTDPLEINGVDGTNAGYWNVGDGIYVAMHMDGTYKEEDVMSFSIANNALPDGMYSYVTTRVSSYHGTNPESLFTDPLSVRVENENALGEVSTYGKPRITIARMWDFDQYLYRRSETDDNWNRIAIIVKGDPDPEFSAIIIDDTSRSLFSNSKTVQDVDYETTEKLAEAAGDSKWGKIFEKDNRLWTNSKNDAGDASKIVFFSEPLAWWRWKTSNSLAFNGGFVGFVSLRDTSNVNVKVTSVFLTSNGLYLVYGTGEGDSKYVRIAHEETFNTPENGYAKVNNKLYTMSDGLFYQDGEWGRKLYSFDLNELKEISVIVQGSAPFDGSVDVVSVNHIGGDKIKVNLLDGNSAVVHLLYEGWQETKTDDEALKNWHIETLTESPLNSYSGKFSNSDRMRIDYKGSISVSLLVDGVLSANVKLDSTARELKEFGLGNVFGRGYSLRIDGSDNGTLPVVYKLDMVKES